MALPFCPHGRANRVSEPSRRHRSEPDGEREGRGYRPDRSALDVAVEDAPSAPGPRLRNHRFFALAELNVAIRRLLDELNMRLMRGYGASRADLFATLDRPNLQPLPSDPYVFARWKRARVAPDYHVEVDNSWYSVPFALIKQEVDVRIADQTVEIFHRGQRVASHMRTPGRRGHVPVFKFMGPTICPPRTAGLAKGRQPECWRRRRRPALPWPPFARW